ncbi:hypothetical protein PENCOP_c007G00516 [Penicillium coprophilum]|uniref:Uncharacterized protein n=1 Tax=Penicillium coprophilum TaxID=36646 RepID=A0A1V6UKT9_9EURO|nr:hypothetical protein PENCOP_c007G00516 [Penicillium coprophilum]
MKDVVVITNNLHELLNWHPKKKPTGVEISAAIKSCQDSLLERAGTVVKQRWLTPWIGLDKMAIGIAMLRSGGPKLKFVDIPEQRGLLGWQDTIAAEAKKEHETKKATKPRLR